MEARGDAVATSEEGRARTERTEERRDAAELEREARLAEARADAIDPEEQR
jgi:hypothetical protein